MSDAAPEWSHPIRLDEIGGAPSSHLIEASPDERAALARRFAIKAIDALSAELAVLRDGKTVSVTGNVAAEVTQACVATGEPVRDSIAEPVNLLFLPETTPEPDKEIELGEADCETLHYSGENIDLGEAAAQTMALALEPFPRSEGGDARLREAGALSEEEAGPFGALKGLRDRLEKGDGS